MSVKRSALSVERSTPDASVSAESPWLGLASFTEETREYFYGRADEVAELARRVQRKLLTVLFGQSGLGKTSILRAGLVPKLRPDGYCPVYVRLDYSPFAPSASEQIKQAVLRTTKEAGSWSKPGASQQGETLWEFFHHRDDVLTDASGRTLTPLLIFDQFEEIFTLAQTDDAGRSRARLFLQELSDLVENRAPVAIEDDESAADRFDFARADYRVLIALREDYLAHLESLSTLMPSITQNRVRLTRMNGGPALEAVLKPGRGLVKDDVARQIIRFVSGARELELAEVEPSLLSLVCRELNEMRIAKGEPEISADLLEGSRDTILNEFYERSLADQPEGVRQFVEDELLTDSGFRESLAEERAQKACAEAGAPNALTVLVDRRLLRIEERLDVRRVELTHDVLCGVVKARRDTRREREAREAAERRAAETEAREAATKKTLLRVRLIAAGCAVLAVVAVGSAIFGFVSLKQARKANELAANARSQAEGLVTYMLDDLQPALEQYGKLPLLKALAENAVKYFDSLPEELQVGRTTRDHAYALASLANVKHALGEHGTEQELFDEARELLRQALETDPNDVEAQARLIVVGTWDKSVALSIEEAVAYWESKIAEMTELQEAHPENLDVLRLSGTLRANFAWFLNLRGGRPAEALRQSNASRDILDRLIEKEPENPYHRVRYTRVLVLQAVNYADMLEFEKALELGQEAVEYAEAALEEDPGNKLLMEFSADAAQQLSYRAAPVDRQLSIDAELISRDRYRTLSELDPTNRAYFGEYIWSHMMEAYGLEAQGHYAAAREGFRKFRELLEENPDALEMRRENNPTRLAEVCLDEARMAAIGGDIEYAREMLAEAHRRFEIFYPDANPKDPEFRRQQVLWLQREAAEVANFGDWVDLENRARANLAGIEDGLMESPGDEEFLIRRAQVRSQLGNALLKQGRTEEARATLAAAAADFRDAPPVPQAIIWDRAGETASTNALLAEALITSGETLQARPVLEESLPLMEERSNSQPEIWAYRHHVVTLKSLLAGTYEPGDPRRAELLDEAEVLLESAPAEAQADSNGRHAAALIKRFRAGD